MRNNRQLVGAFGMFTGVNAINAAIPFFLLPILTEYLLPEEYVIVDIFQNICLFLIPIIGLNILSSIERFYFDRDKLNFTKYISTSVIFSFLTVLTLLIFVWILNSIFTLSILNEIPVETIYIALAFVFFSQLTETQLSLWRVEVKPIHYGGLRIIKSIIDICLSYYFIVNLHWSWEGRIYGQLVAAILAAIFAIYTLWSRKWINISFSYNYLQEGLKFSKPLIFHTLSGYIIGFSDRIFILYMVGAKEAGIYAVAYQVGMVMSLIQNSFNQVWAPHSFKILKEGKRQGLIDLMKVNYVYIIVTFLLIPLIMFAMPFIYSLFINKLYDTGVEIVFWILLGYAFNGMYRMLVNYLIFSKNTRDIALNTVITAISNLALNYILIAYYGPVGAAIATTISFIILLILTFNSVQKFYNLPWILK